MDLTSLNVSLPRPMKQFIESQVAEGHYSTPSEYVRALVREAQLKQGKPEFSADDVTALKKLISARGSRRAKHHSGARSTPTES